MLSNTLPTVWSRGRDYVSLTKEEKSIFGFPQILTTMDPKEGLESTKDEKIVGEGGDAFDTIEHDEEDDNDVDHLIWDTGKCGPHEFEETHFNKPTYCIFYIY
jgi:hypothetical protein